MKIKRQLWCVVIFLTSSFLLGACSEGNVSEELNSEELEPSAEILPVETEETLPEEQVDPNWRTTQPPSARRYHSFAYDTESQMLIMVGGQSKSTDDLTMLGRDNTWAFDIKQNAWAWMNPSVEPPKIYGSQLSYDTESDRVIFYGGVYGLGFEAEGIGDTWAYDYNSNTWEEKSDGPLRFYGARIIYDSESDVMVIFGGSNWGFSSAGNDVGNTFNETWVFDFNKDIWINMQPDGSPPGRWYQPMAYDSKADRVVMWGGTDQNGDPADDGTVWLYDYNTNSWEGIAPREGLQPDPDREGAAMVYDSESDRMILYGGDAKGSETWVLDLNTNTWTLMDTGNGPAGSINLSFFAMAYIPEIDRVILSGGNLCDKSCTYLEGLWSYDYNTNTWVKLKS
jgi:hypothetical protein